MAKLSYAISRAPWYGRRRTRRHLLVALVLVLAIVGFRWGNGAADRVRLAFWQRQCVDYGQAPDAVVFDRAKVPGGYFQPQPAAASGYVSALASSGRLLPWPDSAIAYLHSRTSQNGTRFLVMVMFTGDATGPSKAWDTDRTGWPGYPSPLPFAWGFIPSTHCWPDDVVKVYAGQSDGVDLSHFTIRCDLKDQSVVLDGHVLDDGYLSFSSRRPPE